MKLSAISAALLLLSPFTQATTLDLNLKDYAEIEKLYLDLHQSAVVLPRKRKS